MVVSNVVSSFADFAISKIMRENLLVCFSLLRPALSARLLHANTVPPAKSVNGDLGKESDVVVFEIEKKFGAFQPRQFQFSVFKNAANYKFFLDVPYAR